MNIKSDNIVRIVEPFWGAWKLYNWGRPIPGIGLSEKVVMDALKCKKNILVTIGKDKTIYEISPVTVVTLAKKYHSVRKVRYGNKVAVVPQNQFKKYEPALINYES